MSFNNAFVPFFSSTVDYGTGDIHFRDPFGQPQGSSHSMGNTTYFHDQLGQNLGSIQHLTNDTSFIHDAHGQMLGSIHHFGDSTTISDSSGMPEHLIQQVGDRMVIQDTHGHIEGTVHQFGDSTILSDALGHPVLSQTDL